MRLQPTAFAGAGNVLATRLFATLSDDEMRREMDNINDAVRARRMRQGVSCTYFASAGSRS
jgi:hypothetical protein